MVSGLDGDPIFSPTVKVSDLDCGFSLYREAQGLLIGISDLIDAIDFGKNRLRFSNHLLGLGFHHSLESIAHLV